MSIYQKFFNETVDENGKLIDLEVHYPENFNFGYDVIDEIAAKTPDKRALVWCNTQGEEHIFSFSDISRESNRVANVLLAAGVKRGDRVMLALKRHYEYWFTVIALHKIGAIMVPVTHMLTPDDIIYRLEAAKINAIICTTQNDVPEHMMEAVQRTGMDCKLWTLKEGVEGFACLNTAAKQAPDTLERQETLATDPIAIYFTSGTTEQPKGVIHDFAYPLAHFVTAKYWQGTKDGGLHFTVSETGWAKSSWGKLYGQWLNECAVMVYDFDNFEPKQMANIIRKYGVTSFCAPPTIYRYMTRKASLDFPALEHASTAGEYMSPDIFEKFKEATGLDVREGYGQTETALLLANFIGAPSKDGALGIPSAQYHIELRNEDGELAKDEEIGEIVVVPKNGQHPIGVLCGYLDDEVRYKKVWRGGVFHTGDAIYRDKDGYYWFHGRFDDIIKSGGYRIGPYEIEEVLMKHPAVLECSVIGVPDKLRGQAIKAIVVLAPGYSASKELDRELRDFCNSQLAEYKWLRIIEFTEAMDKTISGKIKKAEQRRAEEARS